MATTAGSKSTLGLTTTSGVRPHQFQNTTPTDTREQHPLQKSSLPVLCDHLFPHVFPCPSVYPPCIPSLSASYPSLCRLRSLSLRDVEEAPQPVETSQTRLLISFSYSYEKSSILFCPCANEKVGPPGPSYDPTGVRLLLTFFSRCCPSLAWWTANNGICYQVVGTAKNY